MILETALVAGLFVDGLVGAEKSSKIDEKALKKYAAAFEKNEKAKQMVQEKAEYLDKRLMNVAKKKKAIINISVPRFAEVYSQIQKLNIQIGEKDPLLLKNLPQESGRILNELTISCQKPLTNQELICGYLNPFRGGFLSEMMVKESERFASAARNQMSMANVVYSQAETACTVYDGIIGRADRLAALLAALNILFLKSIEKTQETIDLRGTYIGNYSETEKGILMTCVNFAVAIADILQIPVVSQDGKLEEASLEAIVCGENYLQKMQTILN